MWRAHLLTRSMRMPTVCSAARQPAHLVALHLREPEDRTAAGLLFSDSPEEAENGPSVYHARPLAVNANGHGAAAGADPLPRSMTSVGVTVGGVEAPVAYIGLRCAQVGLAQANGRRRRSNAPLVDLQ